jgi:drug/metabolite transporter (DMT)-like permease
LFIGRFRTAVLTICALIAFAANSVLCRIALGNATIDAASFTAIRLISGAALLFGIVGLTAPGRPRESEGGWPSALMLFAYAICFSFAYMKLGAGTGALILFGCVQATMISVALRGGERPHYLEWTGLLIALGGLFYLVMPGLTAPPPVGAGLMAVAGIAWGAYSLRGKGSKNALGDTAGNFIKAVPFAVAASFVAFSQTQLTTRGAMLAVASGAVASGLGYVIWYAALRDLSATRAATVQLAVPALAAAGGVAFLAERVSFRLVVSAVLILGGVGLAILRRDDRRKKPVPATIGTGSCEESLRGAPSAIPPAET